VPRPALRTRVIAAAATPFQADLGVDHPRMLAHTKWLLANGCDSVVLFGSTGEAASLTVRERQAILERLLAGGVPPAALLIGAGCCAIEDTVALAAAATSAGCAGALIHPPFFFKGTDDEGIEEFYRRVIDAIADPALRVYLYHYPQAVGAGVSLALTERLLSRYPQVVAGYKDSSGDFANCCAVQRAFPALRVFVSNETRLLELAALGGAGCISATANVQPGAIRRLLEGAGAADSAEQQTRIAQVRASLEGPRVVSNVKAVLAGIHADAEWTRVRPPLTPLGTSDALALQARLGGYLDRAA
jgi:4-hydroxy-tetrahydrodipicolinate synthase